MTKYIDSNIKKLILIISILLLLCVCCKQDPSSQYTYHYPENINDGFDAGSLADGDAIFYIS